MILLTLTAGAVPTENHVLPAVPSPGPVKLDGDLSDWDHSGAIVLTDDTQQPGRLVRVSAMYDVDGLYLAFEFKDPTPMSNYIDPVTMPGKGWRGDAVQLRINSGPSGPKAPIIPELIHHIDCYWSAKLKQPAAYVVTTNMGKTGSPKKIIEQAIGKGVDAAFRIDDNKQGYVQEMRLLWSLLRPHGRPYSPGQSFRMAIETIWGNRAGDGLDRITDLLNPAQPHRQAIWTKPDAWGIVHFVDKGQAKPSDTALSWDIWLKKYRPVVMPADDGPLPPDRPCLFNSDPVARLLNKWYAEGTAAGNTGDYYDNRDRGHSSIPLHLYPQLRQTQYTEEQLKARLDIGLAMGVWPYPTVGNSSTSAPPEKRGSNPRQAQTDIRLLHIQRRRYLRNNLNIYPEHQDYDPGRSRHPGFGDLYPLNIPYLLISQGSSGSDRVFLHALIRTLAAFAPPVKKVLVEYGLLMPTIQQIFRASNKQVVQDDDYFTGKAHPIVFQGDRIDEMRMVMMAHQMTLDSIPPLARVRVLEEQPVRPGIDAPKDMPSEILCNLPEVVGRVHRRWARTMSMKLTAADSIDWQNKSLTYRWVLLQGDPKLVTITPSADGREAEICLGWHQRFDVPGDAAGMQTNRVDIGLFVSNGQSWSTPAFICIFYLDNELRTYDANDRLVDMFSAAVDTTIGYNTNIVIPADRTPAYDIRDWSGLIEQTLITQDAPVWFLFDGKVNDDQRQILIQAVQQVSDAVAEYEATAKTARQEAGVEQKKDQPIKLNRKHAAEFSKPLLKPQEILDGVSAKNFIEDLLNQHVNNPSWYLRERAILDQAAGAAPGKLEKARQRLINLGIYRTLPDGGWQLHSIRTGPEPVVQRLTGYERMEIQLFQLTLVTEVLLPGIVVRDVRVNHVDDRITRAQPIWKIFTCSAGLDKEVTIERRETDKVKLKN